MALGTYEWVGADRKFRVCRVLPNPLRRSYTVHWNGVFIDEIADCELMAQGWERIERWIDIESRMPQRMEDSRLWC